MNNIELLSLSFLLLGSILMAILPYVMSGSGTSPADWKFIYLKIRTKSLEIVTYKRYWIISWSLIMVGSIISIIQLWLHSKT